MQQFQSSSVLISFIRPVSVNLLSCCHTKGNRATLGAATVVEEGSAAVRDSWNVSALLRLLISLRLKAQILFGFSQ